MPRLRLLAATALAAFALPVASADAAPYKAAAYGYNAQGKVVLKTSFPAGAAYALRFADLGRDRTRFTLCAYFKGARRGCARSTTVARGRPTEAFSAGIYTPKRAGTLTWQWIVDGRIVARTPIRVTAPR